MYEIDTRPDASATARRSGLRGLLGLWALGTGVAAVLAALTFLLASQATGALVVTGGGEVTLGSVIGFTFLGGTVGALIAYASRRMARKPRLTFLAVALIGLAGYAVVPFTAAGSLETAVWLNTLHLVVAIPVIGALIRYLPRTRNDTPA